MAELLPSSRGPIPSEESRIINPLDSTTTGEKRSDNDLSQSLLSEFWQSVPSSKFANTEPGPRQETTGAEDGSRKPAAKETMQTALVYADEPPPPGADPVPPRSGQDRPAQPPRKDSLADLIAGQAEQKIESLIINGRQVKVRSVQTGLDRSRTIVLDEAYGVNPAGSKITFYDQQIFPRGKPSPHGDVRAISELPDGSKVYSKVGGNVVYDLAKPISVDDNVNGPKSKFFEELPNGSQLWRTIDGIGIEKHVKDSMSTSKGKIERIELKNGKLHYTTQDSKSFTVEEQGGKLLITDLIDGKPGTQTKVDRFVENFNPTYNHGFYGPASSRTRLPGAIQLDLGKRGECTIYLEPKPYDDKRKTHSVIRDPKDGSTQLFLSDRSVVTTRNGTNARDWVKTEAMTNGTQTVTYKNGDSITKFANGDRTERFKDGLATSLKEKVVEVQRTRDKNIYVLADGGTVEMKLKTMDPLIKKSKDGTSQIMKEDSIKEHFEHPHSTVYGPVKGMETKNTGDVTYSLADNQEYAKITLLGTHRNNFKGYVTYPDGTNRMVHPSGRVLPSLTLSQNQVNGLLNGELKPSMIPNLTRLDYQLLFGKTPPGGPPMPTDIFDPFRR